MTKASDPNETLSFSKMTPLRWIGWVAFCVLTIGIMILYFLPFLAERRYRDGFNFHAQKRFKYAVEELELAVEYAPYETHYIIQLGKTLEDYAKTQKLHSAKVANLERAVRLYQQAIEMNPRNPWFRNRLGTVYTKLGKLIPDQAVAYQTKAHEQIRIAAENDTQNPLFQLNYAFFLQSSGQDDAAIPYYRTVVEFDPRIVEASNNLAEIYRKKGDLDNALTYYLITKKQKPDFPNINLIIGGIYIQQKKFTQALEVIEQGLERHPAHKEGLLAAAQVAVTLQSWQKAVKYYDRFYKTYPEETTGYTFYIQSLVNANKPSLAYQKLKIFIENNPDDENAKKQLKELQKYLTQ